MVAQTNLLAGVVVHAATRPSYTWSKGAMDGGGYCNAMAADPLNPGCAAAAGDVWGEFATRTGGDLWYPTMTGATSIGAIYGRAVAYSRKTPGLRYFGIGVLKNASNQGYLGAVAPGSLLAASYRTSDRAGSQVWRITNPRGTATVAPVPGAPAVVEDIAVVDGVVYAACGMFGLFRVDPTGTWTALAAATFRGCHLSSVAGHGGVLWVGNGIGMRDHRYIAKSTNAGRSFVWTTKAANVSDVVMGANRSWWLASAWPGLDKHGYSVSQLAVDPVNPNVCYSAGRSGIVATRDGGTTWRPAMNGLDGSEIIQVQAGPRAGEAWATDTDWKGIHTLDHWQTCRQTPYDMPRLHPPALVRNRAGVRYEVSLSNPRRMLVGGIDVATDYFRSAAVNPSDLAVSGDRRIYVGLYGGGVLVGRPR